MRGRMNRTISVLVAAVAGALVAAPTASAEITPYPGENPWVDRNFLNIAHQGGEDEVPSATMYALKTAVKEAKVDMLEIDVQLTADGHLVVIHDDTWTRTGCHPDDMPACPNPPPGSFNDGTTAEQANALRAPFQIRSHTLEEVREVDAGYWFRPNSYSHSAPASEYLYRGVATGGTPAPFGYSASDFKIPTLEEVLDTFAQIPINIEIKMPKSYDPANPYVPPFTTAGNECGADPGVQLCDDLDLTVPTTAALVEMLTREKYANRDDIIVVSFAQPPMEQFAEGAPGVDRAPSAQELADYILAGLDPDPGTDPTLDPDPAAFQVPPMESIFAVPNILLGPPFNAHANNRAVHIFTDGDADETEARYQEFYDLGVDGLMTSRPRALHAFLCAREIPHPDGRDRCPVPTGPYPTNPSGGQPAPEKKCKKGQKLKKNKCVKKKKKKKGKKK
jgi:glycerophosphoryl diester phosphodiesterase